MGGEVKREPFMWRTELVGFACNHAWEAHPPIKRYMVMSNECTNGGVQEGISDGGEKDSRDSHSVKRE